MGKTPRIVPYIIPLLVLIGCGENNQKFEPESNIFALMVISEDNHIQYIIVDQSFDVNDSLPPIDSSTWIWDVPPLNGVDGAKVSISCDGSTIDFIKYPLSNYKGVYSEHVYKFNDDKLYNLNVILPWGDTVTGSAMMPSQLTISWPKNEDTISIQQELSDSNLVYWNRCENVLMYMINFVENFWGGPGSYPYFTTDTCCPFFALRASCVEGFFYPFFPYKFIVMGVTPEYVQYMDPRSGGRANLSSGYGVFAGITFDTVSVYFIE